MRVRPARPGDAEAISAVRVLGWQVAYRGVIPDAVLDAMVPDSDGSRRWLEHPAPGARVLVAEIGKQVVGFVGAGPDRDGSAGYEIYLIYVHPERQGEGAGRALMTAALAGVDDPVVVWVLAANTAARAFYARLGFVPDGAQRREDFGGVELEEIRLRRPAGLGD